MGSGTSSRGPRLWQDAPAPGGPHAYPDPRPHLRRSLHNTRDRAAPGAGHAMGGRHPPRPRHRVAGRRHRARGARRRARDLVRRDVRARRARHPGAVRSATDESPRNPMYWGAFIALGGAALFYESPAPAGYAFIFLGVIDRFVRWYEEPTLRRLFGEEYAAYFREVGRW